MKNQKPSPLLALLALLFVLFFFNIGDSDSDTTQPTELPQVSETQVVGETEIP